MSDDPAHNASSPLENDPDLSNHDPFKHDSSNHDSSNHRASELVELERSQIAHEIHDSLLPQIFAAAAIVQSLLEVNRESGLTVDDQQKLKTASQWLQEALNIGRDLLHRTYPPELTGSVWTRAAKDTVERFCDRRETTIQWHLQPAADDAAIAVSVAAYRIVVEAVRNATSHGGACQINIDAAVDEDSLCLKISDDGCGFNPQEVPSDRFGIRSMKGRALLVGGTLSVDSSPQQGTTIELVIPHYRRGEG